MKTLKKLLSLIIIPIAFISCQNDDDVKEIIPGPPTGTEIRYDLTVSSNMINAISYRNANAVSESGILNPDSPTHWTKTIIVQKPFITRLDARFKNTTSSAQTYSFKIFVDGVLADTQDGTVAVAPEIPVNPDDPFPTVLITKTFDVE